VPERRRNIVIRADGCAVNVARPRGQLFVCATGCCCGRTDDGFAPVPSELYHQEWERRRLRNVVHLTIGGCLGPCALANVVLLLFDGQALWFHSMNSGELILALYDHIERMLDADRCVPVPPALARYQFTASAWQSRPDDQPVDDHRPRRRALGAAIASHGCVTGPGSRAASDTRPVDAIAVASHSAAQATRAIEDADVSETRLHERLATLNGGAAVPRANGELVFDAPWQGRVFGMAVALSERGVFPWEEFRQALITEVAAAEARGGAFRYYDAWLAAFERVLASRGAVSTEELEETTFQFEYGERDDVL
jgi:nitrile hydratase accessory protein